MFTVSVLSICVIDGLPTRQLKLIHDCHVTLNLEQKKKAAFK